MYHKILIPFSDQDTDRAVIDQVGKLAARTGAIVILPAVISIAEDFDSGLRRSPIPALSIGQPTQPVPIDRPMPEDNPVMALFARVTL